MWETARWKQVHGPVDAGVCEKRDLGFGIPRWHARLFEVCVVVDVKVVCQQALRKLWQSLGTEVAGKK